MHHRAAVAHIYNININQSVVLTLVPIWRRIAWSAARSPKAPPLAPLMLLLLRLCNSDRATTTSSSARLSFHVEFPSKLLVVTAATTYVLQSASEVMTGWEARFVQQFFFLIALVCVGLGRFAIALSHFAPSCSLWRKMALLFLVVNVDRPSVPLPADCHCCRHSFLIVYIVVIVLFYSSVVSPSLLFIVSTLMLGELSRQNIIIVP